MRFALLLSASVVSACAAQTQRSTSVGDRGGQRAPLDAIALDATASAPDGESIGDALASVRVRAPRAASSSDASIETPSSFAEVLDNARALWWRTDSARGSVCTRWTPRRVDRDVMPHVLSATVTIRCVEYSVNVGASIDRFGALALRGAGGNVSSRTGGHGWMRATNSSNRTVSWVEHDEHRIVTSEGPWFLSEQACEASSEQVAATAPSSWSSSLAPADALASAGDASELRWVIASLASRGPEREIVEGVERLFRDGATVWEATPDGRSCRSWSVHVDREQRATLERTLAAQRGVRETQRVQLAWRAACGEFDQSGCTRTFAGRGIMGGAQSSSFERMLFVDRAGADWIEVGELRLHSAREACLRSRARAAGPMMTACD